MISELMPHGYDNMFFALFGITNRAVRFFYSPHSLASELDYILIGDHDTVVYYRPQRHPSHHQYHPEQLDGLSFPVCHLRNGHGGYHVRGC